MDFSNYLPIWSKLTPAQQSKLRNVATYHHFHPGMVVHSSSIDCTGILLIHSGQLRTYMISDSGKEVTLYRLFERDICLFSASCMMPSIQFDITIEAEKDTEAWLIPPSVYKSLMNESIAVANYTNELMASRFSDVMWMIEQVMWKSFDKRLADFLLEESTLENTLELKITHEKIANHLGTAREVVTRMLKHFQTEGLVKLSRGTIEITDEKKLGGL